MRKVLLMLLAAALVVTFAASAMAKQAMKEETEITSGETVSGKFITKEHSKLDTGLANVKVRTTTIENGQFTTEKGTVIMTPHAGDVKVDKLKIKSYNDNNPAMDSDDTITVLKGKEEFLIPACKDMKQNRLQKEKKEVTVYSTYNPMRYGWEAAYAE